MEVINLVLSPAICELRHAVQTLMHMYGETLVKRMTSKAFTKCFQKDHISQFTGIYKRFDFV